MNPQKKAIRRFRRQLLLLFVLKYALPLATAYALVWGTAVLTLRAAAGVERLPLLWGLVGLAGCIGVAVAWARRRMPSDTAIRALLDEQSGCGGLLMTAAEQEIGGWRPRMPELRLPAVQWEGRRAAMLLVVAAGFVLLAFLAPQGLADLASHSSLDVDREISRLVEQIALLKGEAMLDPERAEMLARKLGDLRENTSGKDPARTLEALDHVRSMVSRSAREAAEAGMRRNEHLGEAEALADILRRNAGTLDSKLKMDKLAELAKMLDRSGLDWKKLAANLDPSLVQSLRDRKFDPEQLRKLAEALYGGKLDLNRQMEKLHKLGLIDAELLEKCQHAGDCEGEGLRAFLQKQGSPTRGPGAAPMTWGKPGTEEGFRFKEEVLPPGALASLKSSPTNMPAGRGGQIVHHKPGGPAESGALRGAKAGSGSANTEVILPRHRAAVERYFAREAPSRK